MKICNLFKILIFTLTLYLLPSQKARSQAVFVYDVNGEEVLAAKNELAKLYPASTTKVMTLYIASDAIKSGKIGIYDKISVSRESARQQRTTANLEYDEEITFKNLMLLAGTISANDAAYAIADGISNQNTSLFIKSMNEKANELKMYGTNFANPTGLHHDDQYSNAHDIGIMMQNFMKNHRGYSGALKSNGIFFKGKYYSPVNLVGQNYKCMKGFKTGFTAKAGYNIVTNVKCKDYNIVATLLNFNTSRDRDFYLAEVLNYALEKVGEKKYQDKRDFYMTLERNDDEIYSTKIVFMQFLPFLHGNKYYTVLSNIADYAYNDYIKQHVDYVMRSNIPFPKK
ncbi:D-alanyl-D-alanine carboxypeptidase family protein [Candidatus Deianiraea vastatrix]|uniref:D-alanyl-D-alanine carboxypeptidase DacF n=1 Tax=Candidatus Deianiraea vastatrix TaxID=2163644 RepID=A0A5B8XDL3_9RICK|nr:serine hydrolase [Candidatus Deianiraea vastatrix]QED23106.1 D-alanyl-D-alanine carboxypeptidase DacF precursor [Candidatus Deianiraea vastatrix]